MTVDETISDFLRDAQYRVAELTNTLIESQQYDDTADLREDLELFMELLYEGRWRIKDGYNHIIGHWSDRDIIDECEYLRRKSGMSITSYMTFAGYYPSIINDDDGSGGGTGGLTVTGTTKQVVGFDASGNPIAIDVDLYGGANETETITQYFSGRP